MSGGKTVSEKIALLQGSTTHFCSGNNGEAGYVNFCRITIKGAWCNEPIIFRILQMGTDPCELNIRFDNSQGIDPQVSVFKQSGGKECQALRVDAGVWDLYIQKSEAWDYIDIISIEKGQYMNGVIVEWRNAHSSDNPGGIIAST